MPRTMNTAIVRIASFTSGSAAPLCGWPTRRRRWLISASADWVALAAWSRLSRVRSSLALARATSVSNPWSSTLWVGLTFSGSSIPFCTKKFVRFAWAVVRASRSLSSVACSSASASRVPGQRVLDHEVDVAVDGRRGDLLRELGELGRRGDAHELIAVGEGAGRPADDGPQECGRAGGLRNLGRLGHLRRELVAAQQLVDLASRRRRRRFEPEARPVGRVGDVGDDRAARRPDGPRRRVLLGHVDHR